MAIYVPGPRSAFSNSSNGSLAAVAAAAAAARPNDRSFLKRLFNRSKTRSPARTTNTNNVSASHSTADLSEKYSRHHQRAWGDDGRLFALPPSPHTHPLLSKPYARDELRPRSSLLSYHLDGDDGPATRKPARGGRCVNGGGVVPADGGGGSGGGGGDVRARSIREREWAARAAAVEGRYVQEWGFFIKCYAEGRFNVSNPPDPPPRRPGFNHFAAPLPPNERERLEAVRACNVSLPLNASDKYHRLVQLAKKLFHTGMASISFVDEHAEIFKAECSFHKKRVDRSESIGAHVLLSNEPMVVLDASKDWRLKGNPLVRGPPHIRFYAGAPIVTFDGRIIGAFSVFDDTPRETFNLAERRKLMDFARHSMTEIENVMEERDMLMSRRTPTPLIDLKTLHDQMQQSIDSVPTPDVNAPPGSAMADDGVPQSPKSPPPPPPPPRIPQTPLGPRTAKKRDAPIPVTRRPAAIRPGAGAGGGGSRPPAINIPTTDPDDTARRSSDSRTSARFSDMPTPPHTPSRPFSISTNGSSLRMPPLSSSAPTATTTATSASTSTSIAPPNPAYPTMPASARAVRGSDYGERPSTWQARYRRRMPAPIHTPNAREVAIQMPLFSPGPITSLAESSFAASIIARSLDYDLVYLLRVSPVSDSDSSSPSSSNNNSSNSQVDGYSTRVLVAHGLPDPLPIFDASLHLRALRSVGGLVYQNPARSHEEDDVGFCLGILLPLLRDDNGDDDDGKDEDEAECNGGIVLAAFTRNRDREASEPFTAEEVRSLREFGEAMKDILVRVDRRF